MRRVFPDSITNKPRVYGPHDQNPGKLASIPFPDCYGQCVAANLLGGGECENICPQKFPIEQSRPEGAAHPVE
ncbi:hypothetical protein HY491_04630 [Candidatus Woesearchaeota archaeon]|nr:hypothetical protein [Candidatus Woesearchaeota archaeon]